MLVQFSVNNFKAIKDSVTFSMLSGKKTEGTFFASEKYKLLYTAAIFGANASGKTTVIDALSMMRRIILNKDKVFLSTDELVHKPHLLSTETEEASTAFDIVFIHNNKEYKYGFEYDKNQIYSEYLYEYNSFKPTCVFDMEKENPLNIEAYPELKDVKKKPDNYLYLWLCDQNNNQPAKNVLEYFKNMVFGSGIYNKAGADFTAELLKDNEIQENINRMIKNADLGIESVSTVEDSDEEASDEKKNKKVYAKHIKYNEEKEAVGSINFLMTKDESFGTYKFFSMLAPVFYALLFGTILVYDEMDASLHPLLLREVIELFKNPKINKKNAQLIITCQDVTLIDELKENPSQINFTEKNKYGETILHSLDEFKGVEYKKKLQDLYLLGVFRSIPKIGALYEEKTE